MGRTHETICEGVFGERRSGKTFFLGRRALKIAQYSDCRGVLIIDPPASFLDDFGRNRKFEFFLDWQLYLDRIHETGSLPRIAVLNLGVEPEYYQCVLQFAIDIGNMCVIVDECHIFAPATKGVLLRELKQISTMGRHLQNNDGITCQTDCIVAGQRPTGIHTDIRDNLNTVIAGKFRGDTARTWILREFGKDALDETDALKQYEWAVLSGRMPPLAPISSLRADV